MIDRTTRIAELLLLEKEVINLKLNTCFKIEKVYPYKFRELTPIEKVVYSILLKIKTIADSLEIPYCIEINPQYKIGKYTVDFYVSLCFKPTDTITTKIIIECDGHDFHEKTKEQAKHDKERDRYFIKNGYKVLRYTGSEIYNNFVDIEKELRDYFVKEMVRGEKENGKD